MGLREWKDRVLAIPWVYDKIRPIVAGGIDHRTLAEFCSVAASDRVFDLGCGTARMLPFLRYEQYLGVDLDPSALRRASRYAGSTVRFIEGNGWDQDYCVLRPTVILMIGVVHHLSDDLFARLVQRLRNAPEPLPRIVTLDVTYFSGKSINNLLSSLDRGRYVRSSEKYRSLFSDNALSVVDTDTVATSLRYVRYVGFHLQFR